MAEECLIVNTVTGEAWRPDATHKITLSIATQPTEFPVESGVNITDHVQVKAERMTLDLTISETPTRPGNVTGANRINKWIAFVRSLASGQPCTIADFRTGTHQNMVLTSGPVTIDTLRKTSGTYEFQQIRVVTATLISNLGASNAAQQITNATARTSGATAPVDPAALQSSLDAANLTVQYNLAAQPTSKVTPSTGQTSVAYELAHAAGLV
jgi:hypothetical protein